MKETTGDAGKHVGTESTIFWGPQNKMIIHEEHSTDSLADYMDCKRHSAAGRVCNSAKSQAR
jgi:hypothetical protein